MLPKDLLCARYLCDIAIASFNPLVDEFLRASKENK